MTYGSPGPARDGSKDVRNTDDDARRSPRTGRVTGERDREKKLRQDDLVLIITSQLVACRRCGKRIKLSGKSHFDPAHWTQHRERCLKNARDAAHSPPWPTETKLRAKRRPPTARATPPPLVKTDPPSPSMPDSPLASLSPSPPPSPLPEPSGPPSPLSLAACGLSSRAFERVHQWSLRAAHGHGAVFDPYSLGEPYHDPAQGCHSVTYEVSDVRFTCQ